MLIHFYKIPRRGVKILYRRMKRRRDIRGNNALLNLLEFENFDMVHSSIFMGHGYPLSRLGGQHTLPRVLKRERSCSSTTAPRCYRVFTCEVRYPQGMTFTHARTYELVATVTTPLGPALFKPLSPFETRLAMGSYPTYDLFHSS